MARRTLTVIPALVSLTLAVPVLATEAPVAVLPGDAPTPQESSGVGSGYWVEPYLITHALPATDCVSNFVPVEEIIARCGDADACSLRLIGNFPD